MRSKPKVKMERILKRGENFVRHVDDLTLWDIEQKYPDCCVVAVQTIETQTFSDEDQAIINYYSLPADKKTIKAYLIKLSGHKKITGDDNQIKFTLNEAMKVCKGATELQIYNAYYYFAFEDESDFFPNIAKLKNKVFSK